MWHQPVWSIAAGCHSLVVVAIEILLRYALQHWLPMHFKGSDNPQNCPFLWEILTLSNKWFVEPPESAPPKRHLEQFSRFCRAHERDKQTRILCAECMWCGLTNTGLMGDNYLHDLPRLWFCHRGTATDNSSPTSYHTSLIGLLCTRHYTNLSGSVDWMQTQY